MRPISSILVVDDEEGIQKVLVRILERGGYAIVKVASSSEEARRMLRTEAVDVILTDMQMPGGSGIDLLTYVHQNFPLVATLMITGVDDKALAEEALVLGAYGYFIKPFRANEVLIGVSNAIRRRSLEIENRDHRAHLESKVKERTSDLWDALRNLELAGKDIRAFQTETIERLAMAGEFRDEETGRHVRQMSRYSEILASAAGVDFELSDSMREASSLHDLGKIGIPDRILLKPGSLSSDERLVMETHAEIGHRILSGSRSPVLKLAAEIALSHHEKVDGTGYPNGLAGDEIPLSGRIAAIADVFDALTTDRVYRRAIPLVRSVEIMSGDSGRHFDPDLLARFWHVMPEVLEVQNGQEPEAVA